MIVVEGHKELAKSLELINKEIGSTRTKRRIMNKAGQPVQDAARNIAPVWSGTTRDSKYGLKPNVHYRYKTGFAPGGGRAGKGKGVIVAAYKAGHLQKSIHVLSTSKLKRASVGVIGPHRNGPGPRYGFSGGRNPKQTDAYYAHMLYGSARAFRGKIMERALQSASPAAARIIEDEVFKLLGKF